MHGWQEMTGPSVEGNAGMNPDSREPTWSETLLEGKALVLGLISAAPAMASLYGSGFNEPRELRWVLIGLMFTALLALASLLSGFQKGENWPTVFVLLRRSLDLVALSSGVLLDRGLSFVQVVLVIWFLSRTMGVLQAAAERPLNVTDAIL